MATVAWLRALPKVELHCHLEGTMRPSTVGELAAANGVALPVDDVRDLYAYDDLTGFLEVFWLVQSVLATPEDWERLAHESIVDGAAHGLRHREAFVTPARHLVAGQDLGDVLAAIDRGLASAERATGVTCALILDLDRELGPELGDDHVARLVELRRAGAPGAERVVGIGMDSTERGVDPRTYAAAYERAGRAGLRRTAHQGENSPSSAIAAALDALGCERIDHGISAMGDPELVARLRDERVALTVCPGANVRINPDVVADLADHVFPAMREAGLLATLGTDDPALVGLDLTQEYAACAATFGYDEAELVAIALDGIEASWLDPGDAARLSAEVRSFADQPIASASAT